MQAVDQVVKGNVDSAYVLCRPPGHHSGLKENVEGFCVFNNVALAARHLLDRKDKKVFIMF